LIFLGATTRKAGCNRKHEALTVCLVHLVGLVYLVGFDQPNKPDKPNRRNKPSTV